MRFPIFQRLFISFIAIMFPAVRAAEQKSYFTQEGDVVFSSSSVGQGGAIITATRSPYSHCGIVFEDKGKMMVLEAVQPVGVVTLKEFISRSEPGTFMLGRCLKLAKIMILDFCGMIKIFIARNSFGRPINRLELSSMFCGVLRIINWITPRFKNSLMNVLEMCSRCQKMKRLSLLPTWQIRAC